MAALIHPLLEECFLTYFEQPHAVIDRSNDPKRFRVLEGLLRDHLTSEITYHLQTRPPVRHNALGLPVSILVLYLTASLERRGDIGLGYLLRAAQNIKESASDDDDSVAIAAEFLHLAVDCLLQDKRSGAVYLYAVLLGLLLSEQKAQEQQQLNAEDDLDSEKVSGAAEPSAPPDSDLTVLIGNETIPVPFSEILAFFWTQDHLDTPCHACALPFVGEPPIRTINIAPGTPTLQVRVFNRHFSCIDSTRLTFVPVSHVWSDSIRDANLTRTHTDAAAAKLIATLTGLRRGAARAYGPSVEFWHDYFSVPQWHPPVKEQLLLNLPAIYHLAPEILVHLEDLRAGYLSHLIAPSGSGSVLTSHDDDPVLRAVGQIPLVHAITSSAWMSRMWVTLEYTQCRAACAMTSGDVIHRSDDTPTGRDTFSRAVEAASGEMHANLFLYAATFGTWFGGPGGYLGATTERAGLERGPPPSLVLGEAIELIASKQCLFPRDRFIALDVMLDGQRTAWLPAGQAEGLPGPGIEAACAHVWRKALRKGDYSPLLLMPRESVAGSNPSAQAGLASWMVGYAGLDGVDWFCEGEMLAADAGPSVGDDGAVRATLARVGEVEEVCYLGVEESGKVDGVAWALGFLRDMARAEGTALSPGFLVDGLNRVFPFGDVQQTMALLESDMVFDFDGLDAADPEFAGRMSRLLAEYEEAGDGPDVASVAQNISDALQLEADIHGRHVNDEVTRLSHSLFLANWRQERGAKGGEPICKVRCPECRRVTPFRLDLRETGGVGQQVYRIPGLGYAGTADDGVGLVIDEGGRITGRMLFGPPACDCVLLVEVEIN
ncbi:hypothetical protein QBC39DRAFT_254443 [Podospora conica]|nr:hypothetical protein QBC39DRAFT_254443 [Schizothecium conicum]